ncbi:MAG: YggU family protein [Candidatus Diapherotrites archaeon]|nr:YggU family protein [Candidatus Diapherotrites archaeon]
MRVIKQTPKGAVINVRVVPGSKEFQIAGEDEWTGDIKVKVKSKAIEGKANQELVTELGKMLSAEVKIISGHKSRRKALLTAKDADSVKRLIK